MRKILSILAAVGLTSTAASAVVACGNKSNSAVGNKTDLATLPAVKALESKLTITGNVSMTADDAWTSFSVIPGVGAVLTSVGLEKTDFKLDLNLPTYEQDGSLKITVNNESSNYSGSLSVKISQLAKTALGDLHLKDQLENWVTNPQAAFDSFIKLNSEVTDLRDNLEITGFSVPKSNQTGSLEIQAKTNTKYSGTLTITIPELKTAIDRLITNTAIQGIENMTANQAFQAVLTANSSWTNLSDYVEYNDDGYVAPTTTADGSLIITAKPNTEFSGNLTITISKVAPAEESSFKSKVTKTDLSKLFEKASGKLKIKGSEGMTSTSAYNEFAKITAVKAILFTTKLKEVDFDLELTVPTKTTDGALKISVNVNNAKYTGSITVVITKLDADAEVNALSTNDDHKTTVITLSTEDSLRLGYIKKDGDKFVAGDKLPNGPLTTKIGESTITATFTPNFENGTVQVLLTIDTPTNN